MNEELAIVRVVRASVEAMIAEDWAAYGGLIAEGFRFEDRRSGLGVAFDKDGTVDQGRLIAELGGADITHEVVETRGDRLGLFRVHFDVDGFEIGMFLLAAIDAADKQIVSILFDDYALDEARTELDRYAHG